MISARSIDIIHYCWENRRPAGSLEDLFRMAVVRHEQDPGEEMDLVVNAVVCFDVPQLCNRIASICFIMSF